MAKLFSNNSALVRALRALLCVSALGVATAPGCRNLDNAQVDVLERELRQQEDYIYELEDYLVEYSEKLRQARCQTATTTTTQSTTGAKSGTLSPTLDKDPIRRPTLPLNGRNKSAIPPLTDAPPAASTSASSTPNATSDPAAPPPADSNPATSAPPTSTTPDLKPQNQSAPEAVKPEEMDAQPLEIGPVGSLPSSKATRDGEKLMFGSVEPLIIPDPADYQDDVVETPIAANAVADTVQPAAETTAAPNGAVAGGPRLAAPQQNASRLVAERLNIRQVFAEGADAEQHSPQSLLVVVEAVNATDEPVDASGDAALMITQSDSPGSYRQIDRWEFTPEETHAAWQSSKLGDGLHLELPLNGRELPAGELTLWARLVGADGKKLLTKIPLNPSQLLSMGDAEKQSAVAAKQEGSAPEAVADPANKPTMASEAAIAKTAAVEAARSPQWRASAVPLNPDRVEGFASTTGANNAAWSSKNGVKGSSAEPRVAAASGKTGTPTWKKSAAVPAKAESRPAWAPDRQ